MKGLIFDIKKYSVNDGPGIRTTVFFKGCPLRCDWCHNPESQECFQEQIDTSNKLDDKAYHKQKTVGTFMSCTEVISEIMKDVVFYEESSGGVTFSGGEPCMQEAFLKLLLRECKSRNIHTALDTCGHASNKLFSEIMQLVDLFLFDLKLIDKELHKQYTGKTNEIIIENFKFLCDNNANIIIRIPIIPKIIDSVSNISAIASLLSDYKDRVREVHLLPYHKIAANKYNRLAKPNPLGDIQELKKEDLSELKVFFEDKGFKVKIGG